MLQFYRICARQILIPTVVILISTFSSVRKNGTIRRIVAYLLQFQTAEQEITWPEWYGRTCVWRIMHAAVFHYVPVPQGFAAVTIVHFEYTVSATRTIFPTRRIKLRLRAAFYFTTLIHSCTTVKTIINSKQVGIYIVSQRQPCTPAYGTIPKGHLDTIQIK